MSDLTGDNKAIRFPKAHYLGYIGRPEQDDLPLAFMTEDGTDKASEKRKNSVDAWVNGNSYSRDGEKKIATFRSYENKPLVGFRLGRSIRRYSSWGSGNVKWRIEDPRGFELEISSPNMAQIAAACVLKNGEILDECIWARLKGDNVLVPVSSELYQAALRNEKRLSTRVKPSQCERGDHIVLQNGLEGEYLGKFECFERKYDRQAVFSYSWKSKPVHAMIVEFENYQGEKAKRVQTFSTFKPSFRTPRSEGPLTPQEALKKALELGNLSDKLALVKSEIQYLETPATIEDVLDKRGSYPVFEKPDGTMWSAGIRKGEWERYQASKTSPPPAQHPLGAHFTHTPRYKCPVVQVYRDDNGQYMFRNVRNRYSYFDHDAVTFAELETLPIKTIAAWIEDESGLRTYL
jgi:hypothetical protein